MTAPEDEVIKNPEQSTSAVAEQAVTAPVEPQPEVQEVRADGAPWQEATAPPAHKSGETLLQSLLSIIVIVLFVITFVVQAFQIPSESMEKTLLIGDYLLVDKIHFGQGGALNWLMPYNGLKRGDIVVFHYPIDPSQHFVKRVIGLPGDHICLREKTVFINGVPLQESYAVHQLSDPNFYRDNFPSDVDLTGQVDRRWRSSLPRHLQHGELVVPDNEYFVMGDNRDRSLDSRYWGFVPRENIVGRPLVIYLSLREREDSTDEGRNGKLFNSGRLLTHVWQFARWDRMFHLVR